MPNIQQRYWLPVTIHEGSSCTFISNKHKPLKGGHYRTFPNTIILTIMQVRMCQCFGSLCRGRSTVHKTPFRVGNPKVEFLYPYRFHCGLVK